ncbi:MAG: hypothetical protein ACLUNS_02215 [Alistipes shahii]
MKHLCRQSATAPTTRCRRRRRTASARDVSRRVVSGSYNRTDGHRADMGFEQYGGYAKLGYEISQAWNVRADVNVTHFNASQPGTVTNPMADADQRITRGMTSLSVENSYGRTSGRPEPLLQLGPPPDQRRLHGRSQRHEQSERLPFQLTGRHDGRIVVPERPAFQRATG